MSTLQHVVLFRLTDKCGDDDVAAFNDQFAKIVQEIDGMLCASLTALEYKDKFNTTNKGYTHCAYTLFQSLEALDQYYNDSPEHQNLKKMVAPFLDGGKEDILRFDSWNPNVRAPPSTESAQPTSSKMEEKSDEKEEEKPADPVRDELAALRLKFGALKWKEVQRSGYPQPRRDDKVVDVYKNAKGDHVEVNDAYRWLEDPDSAETREWIEEQVDIAGAYLSKCGAVQEIKETITRNQNFPRFGTPSRKGSDPVIYYYAHNSGLQNQSVLYFHEKSLDAPRRCLLDPNTLSDDGTTSAQGYYFSENARYLCYGLSKAGSDWREFHVKEVLSGKKLDDVLMWCKFTGITWTHDNLGFFYSRYSKPDSIEDESKKGTETDKCTNQQLWYHRLGTKQQDDIFLIDAKTLGNEDWMVGAGLTWCGRWLELYISLDCDPVNRLYLLDISDPKVYSDAALFQKGMIKLVDTFDAGYDCINNEDAVFYFKTNHEAGNYRIVSCDVAAFVSSGDDAKVQWTEVVPEREFRMETAKVVGGDKLLLEYNENVQSVIKLLDFKGNEVKHNIAFPAAGSIGATGSKKHQEGFFSFTSFLYPGTKYSYNYATDEMKVWKQVEVKGFRADDFETKQVFYPSKDGTKIPMYVMSPKGMKLDGSNPTILYGYGGFDISLFPDFRVARMLWLKHTGGVFVSANLRGGGEYGEKWHQMGTKDKKQNVFDDFHAAAEWLIANKYTNPDKLAIEGGSNGGLLVSACCNQRPDLYRCGVAHCGVLDMLRFHKFTIGYAWCSDYGCADNAEEFDALYSYSPLLNIPTAIKDRQYPCFMATTADHDDRVSPLHSFKFVAELQHRLGGVKGQENPLLIRIECKSGHGSSSLTKGIELRADTMAFQLKCLGAEWK